MPALTCNACNGEFADEAERKLHYRSEWHRYNLKRKVAGVPGVTEALFLARQTALAEENRKSSTSPMLHTCALCQKEYRSAKAHSQHLNSRSHIIRASQESDPLSAGITVVRPLIARVINKNSVGKNVDEESEESDDEWVEVDPNDDVNEALEMDEAEEQSDRMDEDEVELDPSCCFICDQKHNTVESCMVHMHKQHGFFIPDVEYLKDPRGFLAYVGLKVKRDFLCLYCNDRCQPFQSLEAVRKHMVAKGHCKVRYGDGSEDEEAELEDFYDYSSSYVDGNRKEVIRSDDGPNNVELGNGSELIITRKTETGLSIRSLGSREFLCYYRQKPRPSPAKDLVLAISLASSYRNMGLATVHSREQAMRMKVTRMMNKNGVEAMRTKIGLKNNIIRNLPRNAER